MELVKVVQKSDVMSAAQFHGTPDLDMAKMIGGHCVPSVSNDDWTLIFESEGKTYKLLTGDWILCHRDGSFSRLQDVGINASYFKINVEVFDNV